MSSLPATTTAKQQVDLLKKTLDQLPLATTLPTGVTVERFQNTVITAVNLNPELLKADRNSLLTSCLKAAADGLLPDNTEGALVTFKTKKGDDWITAVQWMPMVQGVIKRILETEGVASVRVREVYKNDTFDYVLGEKEYIEHKPTMGDPGEFYCVYAIITFKDSSKEPIREVMRKDQVDKVRAMSKSPNGPAWDKFYGEMARKSCLHRASKWLPKGQTTADFLRRQIEDDVEILEIIPEPSRKKLTRLEKFEGAEEITAAQMKETMLAITDKYKLNMYWQSPSCQNVLKLSSADERKELESAYLATNRNIDKLAVDKDNTIDEDGVIVVENTTVINEEGGEI